MYHSGIKKSIVIDSQLSDSSENLLQNKVIAGGATNLNNRQTSLNNNIANRAYPLTDRLRAISSTTTVTFAHYLRGQAGWPDMCFRISWLVPDSSSYYTGTEYDSVGPTPNKGYSFTESGTALTRLWQIGFITDTYSCIRLSGTKDNISWYLSRDTSNLVGTGKYIYIRLNSTSCTITAYNSPTETYGTSYTDRYLVISGTYTYFVSDT